MQERNNELKIKLESQQIETTDKIKEFSKEFDEKVEINKKLKLELQEQIDLNKNIELKVRDLCTELETQTVAFDNLKREKCEYEDKVKELKNKLDCKTLEMNKEVKKLQEENLNLQNIVEKNKMGNIFIQFYFDLI